MKYVKGDLPTNLLPDVLYHRREPRAVRSMTQMAQPGFFRLLHNPLAHFTGPRRYLAAYAKDVPSENDPVRGPRKLQSCRLWTHLGRQRWIMSIEGYSRN
jgi:hypothetical protein